MSEEFKPLKRIERGCTVCVECNTLTGMIDACCVRSAVMGMMKERDNARKDNDIFRKSSAEVQDDWEEAVEKWFPVFFQDDKEKNK